MSTSISSKSRPAIAFWRHTMGLKATSESEDGAESELPDGSTFELWKMDDGSWTAGNGIVSAAPDVAAAADAFRAKGVRVTDHIEDTPVCNIAFAEDGEGNTVLT